MAFKYSTAQEEVANAKSLTPGWKNLMITRHSGTTDKHDNPMLVVNFRIEDSEDVDDGKETVGFIRFLYDDQNLATIDQFLAALDMNPMQEFGDSEINPEFLKAWGERVLGQAMQGYVSQTKDGRFLINAPNRESPAYRKAGSQALPKGVTPIDLE